MLLYSAHLSLKYIEFFNGFPLTSPRYMMDAFLSRLLFFSLVKRSFS